jgi:formylglycine-generating enzyme required for sulfatase activity
MSQTHIHFTDSFGCKYYLVEPQSFTVGDGTGRDLRASPSQECEIVEPFFVAETPFTQGMWVGLMNSNPSKHQEHIDSFYQPVESVSFDDVKALIQMRNEMNHDIEFLGLQGHWRLPSEVEWECFARAGSTSVWSFGDDEHELSSYAWYGANSGAKIQRVKMKKANAWNLFDIHGLISEWCEDHWDASYDKQRSQMPFRNQSDLRIIRGGSWFTDGTSTTCFHRSYAPQGKKSDGIGFRLVWEPKEAIQ